MSAVTVAVRDSTTMFRRDLRRSLRYPAMTISGIIVPVLFLLLFAGVFGRTMHAGLAAVAPHAGSYINYVAPGILLMTAAAAAKATALNVVTDMSEGIITRFRTMAVTRAAVLSGQVLGSLLRAVTAIDRAMQAKIRLLQRHRRRVAQLGQGERLFVSDEVAHILERLRALGVSEQSVHMERDGWILLSALSPELVAEWADQKRAALDDPDFQHLYLAFDRARDWDPADPRLEQLAVRALDWVASHRDLQSDVSEPSASLSVAASLIAAQVAEASPALRRLADMARE